MNTMDYLYKDILFEKFTLINGYISKFQRKVDVKVNHKNHRRKETRVPISEKATLTLDEAAEYSNIGIHRLREMVNDRNDMFIRVGAKNLVKRRRLDEFIENATVI